MKKRRDVAIELTPLLDVILILLFLIMSGSSKANEEVKQKADSEIAVMQEEVNDYSERNRELERTAFETQIENDRLAAKIDGYNKFSDYARIITISYSLGKDGRRAIVIDNEGELSLVEFDWDSVKYGENTVKTRIGELLGTDGPVFISFSYSDDRIYESDYKMLTGLIVGFQSDRVFTKIQKLENE